MPITPATEEPGNIDPHVIIHDQMISNVVQIGKIVKQEKDDPEQPTDGAYVLVHIGGEEKGTYTRNWMSWLVSRSGYDAEWWMPEVDEQVVVVAPSGNLALAVIIGTVYRGKWLGFAENNDFSKAPEAGNQIPADAKAHIHERRYKDGSAFQYDREKHVFNYQIKTSAKSEPSGFSLKASLDQGQGNLLLSLGKEEEENKEKKTIVKLGEGKVDITAPEKITFQVGKSSLVMDETSIVLNVEGTKLTLNKAGVDVA